MSVGLFVFDVSGDCSVFQTLGELVVIDCEHGFVVAGLGDGEVKFEFRKFVHEEQFSIVVTSDGCFVLSCKGGRIYFFDSDFSLVSFVDNACFGAEGLFLLLDSEGFCWSWSQKGPMKRWNVHSGMLVETIWPDDEVEIKKVFTIRGRIYVCAVDLYELVLKADGSSFVYRCGTKGGLVDDVFDAGVGKVLIGRYESGIFTGKAGMVLSLFDGDSVIPVVDKDSEVEIPHDYCVCGNEGFLLDSDWRLHRLSLVGGCVCDVVENCVGLIPSGDDRVFVVSGDGFVDSYEYIDGAVVKGNRWCLGIDIPPFFKALREGVMAVESSDEKEILIVDWFQGKVLSVLDASSESFYLHSPDSNTLIASYVMGEHRMRVWRFDEAFFDR